MNFEIKDNFFLISEMIYIKKKKYPIVSLFMGR